MSDALTLTLAALVPLVALALTSFVKISVVLSLLRNAFGTPEAPSTLVVTALSLILTAFVMAPVALRMKAAAEGDPVAVSSTVAVGAAAAVGAGAGGSSATTGRASGAGGGSPIEVDLDETPPSPSSPSPSPSLSPVPGPAGAPGRTDALQPGGPTARARGQADGAPAGGAAAAGAPLPWLPPAVEARLPMIERGLGPLREFLAKHAGQAERTTFVDLAHRLGTPSATGDELWVLAPAFVASELREAFAIAIVLLIPFLVLDVIVALTLGALGLATTSPQVVALPLKLALFVAVDGWRLLLEGLVRGYL